MSSSGSAIGPGVVAAAVGTAIAEQKGDPGGLAPLGADQRVPDGNLPERLGADELSATYAAPTKIADKAFGNDATDAKAHFQSIMDALSTFGGGELRIPRGTYRVSGSLFVPSNVTLRGEGRQTVLKATFSAGGLIYNKGWNDSVGNTDTSVIDLTVDGNGTANQGITFAGVKRGTIHNVRVKGCSGYGIWIWASGEDSVAGTMGVPTQQVTVSACHITDTIDTGIEASACRSVTIVGNTVEGTAGRGLYAWAGATDVIFSANTVTGVGTNEVVAFQVSGLPPAAVGVYPTQTTRITFVGNSAYNVRKGLKVSGSSGNAPTDITLNSNSAYTTLASSNGVDLDYCTRVMLDGNHIEGFANPLRVSDPATGATPGSVLFPQVQNNRFVGGGTSSIYGCTSGQVNGNQFSSQSNHPLALQGCTGMTVNNNYLSNPTATSNVSGIVLYDYSSTPCTGNILSGNHSIDTRATNWLQQAVLMLGAADYNVATGNSARGAKSGSQAVQNAGTGVNNTIANNINA